MLVNNTFSIYIKGNYVSISIFKERSFLVVKEFIDTYRYRITVDMVKKHNPYLILANSSLLCGILLSSGYNVLKVNKQIPRNNLNLSKVEHASLQLMLSYSQSDTVIKLESIGVVGMVGSYPIKLIEKDRFYIGPDTVTFIKSLKPIKQLQKIPITRFGKVIIQHWVTNPLIDSDAIKKRNRTMDFLISFLPQIKACLKYCKIPPINKDLNLLKLKECIISALKLSKLLNSAVLLENSLKYKKILKLLDVIDESGIKQQKSQSFDNACDLLQSIPNILYQNAIILSSEYSFSLSLVYIPQLGFLVESPRKMSNTISEVKDKFYCRTKETAELDKKYGDPYSRLKKIEQKILKRILKCIYRQDFSFLYDFIGEIDGLIALIQIRSAYENDYNSIYQSYLEDAESSQGGIEMLKEKDITGNKGTVKRFNGFQQIENISLLIVFHQLAILKQKEHKIEIYDGIAIHSIENVKDHYCESSFKQELVKLGKILRESNDKSCIILNCPFESTNDFEGLKIFKLYIQRLQFKRLFIKSSYLVKCHLKEKLSRLADYYLEIL